MRTGGGHPEFYQGIESTMAGWKNNIEATEAQYKPGKFTTFHAFEWSAAPQGGNLHRNVIFRDNVVPDYPFSAINSSDPRDLWKWMMEMEQKGSRLLAIPHNSNGSKGMMFPENDLDGNPLSSEYASIRQQMEPLIEIMQIKGNSEVYPKFWTNDEFANFENAESIQNFSGRTFEERNFVRSGLKEGLRKEQSLGVNPFKYGFAGGTDNHNGTPSNVEEDNYLVGSHGLADKTAETRVTSIIDGWANAYDINPGSLMGVWAEANTREDIWDAMKARETFATSGPRIQVRMFAGYSLDDSYASYADMVSSGMTKGVAMGSDLPGSTGESPKFGVWAIKDPMGPNLDRLQIIKGWVEDGEVKEKIFNVAVSDGRMGSDGSVIPIEAPVDKETGAFNTEKGSVEFLTVWTDPDFDPNVPAFYYLRVIQLPTARWTRWDEIREGVTYPENLPEQIQERAWGSPMWYRPSK
jgi:hypothetical protein